MCASCVRYELLPMRANATMRASTTGCALHGTDAVLHGRWMHRLVTHLVPL